MDIFIVNNFTSILIAFTASINVAFAQILRGI
jgi:hypothetical protein